MKYKFLENKYLNFIIGISLIVGVSSCNSPASTKVPTNSTEEIQLILESEQGLFGVWKRERIDRSYADKQHEEFAKRNPVREYKNYYISLFPDGKGSINFNAELDTFIWEISIAGDLKQPQSAAMHYNNSTISLLEIGGDTLLQVSTDNGYSEMYFKKVSNLTTNFEEDPNYPYNNLWRVRAKKPISDVEIEFKVDNYLKHYKFLFKASFDEKSKRTFTNKHSKGILRVYKSAIGIVDKNEISEDWYSYFYNEKEAVKSYDILKEKLKNNKKRIKKSDNWILDNYKILENIIGNEK